LTSFLVCSILRARVEFDAFSGATVKLSRAGVICCGFYAFWFVLLVGRSYFVDTKTGYLLAQLAVVPAVIVVSGVLGLLGHPQFPIESPLNNIFVFGAVSFVLSYLFGWMLGAIGRAGASGRRKVESAR
jgi:hypothetical protein